jgi:hypothetical protein
MPAGPATNVLHVVDVIGVGVGLDDGDKDESDGVASVA